MDGTAERLATLASLQMQLAAEAAGLADRVRAALARLERMRPVAGTGAAPSPRVPSLAGPAPPAAAGVTATAEASGPASPRMVPFPKIEQFRTACSEVGWYATVQRRKAVAVAHQHNSTTANDDDREAEVDAVVNAMGPPDLPTIEFTGTVKLHGTNAAVCCRGPGGDVWCQSRSRVLTEGADNAGWRAHVEAHRAHYQRLLSAIWNAQAAAETAEMDAHRTVDAQQQPQKQQRLAVDGGILCVYGEWCGKGIQKGVAVSDLAPTFVVFAVAFSQNNSNNNVGSIAPDDGGAASASNSDADSTADDGGGSWRGWMDPIVVRSAVASERVDGWRVHHIMEFEHFTMRIDFNHPESVQDRLSELTRAVEARCPVAAALGVSGVGEGVVWVGQLGGRQLRFKVKGDAYVVPSIVSHLPFAFTIAIIITSSHHRRHHHHHCCPQPTHPDSHPHTPTPTHNILYTHTHTHTQTHTNTLTRSTSYRQCRLCAQPRRHTMFRRDKLAASDVAKVLSAESFAEQACTPARMEQGVDELFIKTGNELHMRGVAKLIKWVQGDIVAEEADTLRENGLTPRDIAKPVSAVVREWFTQRMQEGKR
jgi:hypothetical protein